jgi:hypothetical protein
MFGISLSQAGAGSYIPLSHHQKKVNHPTSASYSLCSRYIILFSTSKSIEKDQTLEFRFEECQF